MQGQTNFADQFQLAGTLVGYKPVVRGSMAGIVASPDEDNNLESVVLTDVRSLMQQADLIDLETLVDGELVYLQLVNDVARITKEPTDLLFGAADCPKAASAKNTFIRIKEPRRNPNKFEIMIDFTNHVHLQTAGLYILRDFVGEGGARFAFDDANALTVRPGLEFAHDGLLAPGATTISIGDGTAGNDQVMAATALSVIAALGPVHTPLRQPLASTPAAVALGALAITLVGGPMTAGRLRITVNLEAA